MSATRPLRSPRTSSSSACKPGMIVMVHSSLGRVGWTDGGPVTVIEALLEVLGPRGTLVMPAESPQLARSDEHARLRSADHADDDGCDPGSIPQLSRNAAEQPSAGFRLRQRPVARTRSRRSMRWNSARDAARRSKNSTSWMPGRCCSASASIAARPCTTPSRWSRTAAR